MGKYNNRAEVAWEKARKCDCGDESCTPRNHRLCAICNGTILYGSHESEESQRGSNYAWNVDHGIAKSKGGTNCHSNARAVHIQCNRAKGNQ